MLAAAFWSTSAYAYGFLGHILCADLTWDLLPPSTKQCLGVKGRRQFIRLACMPDQRKHKPGMHYAIPFHYYNTQDYPPYYCQDRFDWDLDGGKNLVMAARRYAQRVGKAGLQGRIGKVQKDLAFCLHFLMDLHQPLHCIHEQTLI